MCDLRADTPQSAPYKQRQIMISRVVWKEKVEMVFHPTCPLPQFMHQLTLLGLENKPILFDGELPCQGIVHIDL